MGILVDTNAREIAPNKPKRKASLEMPFFFGFNFNFSLALHSRQDIYCLIILKLDILPLSVIETVYMPIAMRLD